MSTEWPLTVTRPNIDATGRLADEDAEGQKFDLNRDEIVFFQIKHSVYPNAYMRMLSYPLMSSLIGDLFIIKLILSICFSIIYTPLAKYTV